MGKFIKRNFRSDFGHLSEEGEKNCDRRSRLNSIGAQNAAVKYALQCMRKDGNIKRCERCKVAAYFGEEHQKADWKTHKKRYVSKEV